MTKRLLLLSALSLAALACRGHGEPAAGLKDVQTPAGQRLTDQEFIQGLDLQASALASVKAAAAVSDWSGACDAFGKYFRQRSAPRWLTEVRSKPTPVVPRPDTTVADRQLLHQWQWDFNGQTYDIGNPIDWSQNQTSGPDLSLDWSASLNRHYAFEALATAYAQTGDERYVQEVVDELLNWIDAVPVLTDRSGNNPYDYGWETLNTALRAGRTWPNALYQILPSAALTDHALCKASKSFVEHARHLLKWHSPDTNWLTWESTALYTVGSLLPEFSEAAAWRTTALQLVQWQMDHEIYPDGLEYELTIWYSAGMLENFNKIMDIDRLNHAPTEAPADFTRRFQAMYDYIAYASSPLGFVPALNDSTANVALLPHMQRAVDFFPDRSDFLWLKTGGRQGEIPHDTSRAFLYAGHFVMRSGWDPEALYSIFVAGPYGKNHQHEHKLHLGLMAYGKELLLDGGRYLYDNSKWRQYVLSTRGHNTVLVDDLGQNRATKPATWVLPFPYQPLTNPWTTTADFDFAQGDYSDGYGAHFLNVKHTRAVLFAKPKYWIVVDTLDPGDSASHSYQALFHLNANMATVSPSTNVAVTDNKDVNLAILAAGWAGQTSEVVKGRTTDPVQGWADLPWRAVPTLVVHGHGAGRQRLVTVLYPLRAGESMPVSGVSVAPAAGASAADQVTIKIEFSDGRRDSFSYSAAAGQAARL